jgi:hypothetical protein
VSKGVEMRGVQCPNCHDYQTILLPGTVDSRGDTAGCLAGIGTFGAIIVVTVSLCQLSAGQSPWNGSWVLEIGLGVASLIVALVAWAWFFREERRRRPHGPSWRCNTCGYDWR